MSADRYRLGRYDSMPVEASPPAFQVERNAPSSPAREILLAMGFLGALGAYALDPYPNTPVAEEVTSTAISRMACEVPDQNGDPNCVCVKVRTALDSDHLNINKGVSAISCTTIPQRPEVSMEQVWERLNENV